MSQMFSGREVIKALRRKGFIIDHRRASHIFLHHLEKNLTIVVLQHRVPKKGTLHAIIKKAAFSLEELKSLI